VELPAQALGVSFDPDHLRRVLVNLLDNALRHASEQPGSVLLRLEALEGDFVRLTVANDGQPIPWRWSPISSSPSTARAAAARAWACTSAANCASVTAP
jgi:signal transduction histidine kinase